MVIVPPTVYGGSELAALLERERVTHCFVTPAALTSVDPDGLTTVGCVVTGGEACPPELVATLGAGQKDVQTPTVLPRQLSCRASVRHWLRTTRSLSAHLLADSAR